MGNVYNGNSHGTTEFINHESISTASLSSTSSNANNKNVGINSGGGGNVGNRVMQTNSPCLNNFLFPILSDVSIIKLRIHLNSQCRKPLCGYLSTYLVMANT